MKEIRLNGLVSLIPLVMAVCLLASLAGVAMAGSAMAVQGSEDEGIPSVMFFIMIGGTFLAVLIPVIIIFVLFLGWVAIDHDSLRKLRSAGNLKKLRRIVVTPQAWWAIGEDTDNLKKELDQAGIKVRIQQVESNSQIINTLIVKENMDLPSAQAMEVARVRGLRYAWIDGKRVKAKDFLSRLTESERSSS
jgi:hypothetical protein